MWVSPTLAHRPNFVIMAMTIYRVIIEEYQFRDIHHLWQFSRISDTWWQVTCASKPLLSCNSTKLSRDLNFGRRLLHMFPRIRLRLNLLKVWLKPQRTTLTVFTYPSSLTTKAMVFTVDLYRTLSGCGACILDFATSNGMFASEPKTPDAKPILTFLKNSHNES